MTKRALVVGINDYSVQGFTNLSYCVNDATAMYYLLTEAWGFDANQTWYYTDGAANSDTIRRTLRYMLQQSEPGDVACFYYSGHGGLVPAANGTYYATIIPASGQFISDFELYQAADELQPSVVNFTVILDSCHSGGMHDESENAPRVRSVPFSGPMIEAIVQGMNTLLPCGLCLPPGADVLQNNVISVAPRGDSGISVRENPNELLVPQAKSTLIAGCRNDESSYEDPGNSFGHGMLTQSLLDLVNASNFQIDHNQLLQEIDTRVGALMAQHYPGLTQSPQLRGQQNRMEEGFLAPWVDSR